MNFQIKTMRKINSKHNIRHWTDNECDEFKWITGYVDGTNKINFKEELSTEK